MAKEKTDQAGGIIVSEDNNPSAVIVEEPKVSEKAPEAPFLEIDGETVTKEEAIAGYMKKKDYTTKTQELSTQKAELETRGKSLEELKVMADWFDDEDNHEGAEQIRKIIRGEKVAPAAALDDELIDKDDPTYKLALANQKALAEINTNFHKLQTSSKQDALSRAQKDIATEKKQAMAKYDFLDEDDLGNIADIALSQDGANLVEVADKYVARLKKYSESQSTAKYKEKENNQKVPSDTGGGGAKPAGIKLKLGDGSARRAFIETFSKSLKEE